MHRDDPQIDSAVNRNERRSPTLRRMLQGLMALGFLLIIVGPAGRIRNDGFGDSPSPGPIEVSIYWSRVGEVLIPIGAATAILAGLVLVIIDRASVRDVPDELLQPHEPDARCEALARDDRGINGCTRPERYLASLCDNLIAFFLIMCVASTASEHMTSSAGTGVNAILGFGVFSIYFAYFLMFETFVSTTPGKLIFSLWIQHLNGSKCTLRAAILRTMTRFVEVNPFLLGCLPAAIVVRCSKRRQRWGDLLAGTIVIDRKPAHRNENAS